MIHHNDREEFMRWNQRESSLVTFARTCRNEDPAPDGDAAAKEPSILTGIDLDNVPDDIRELLIARDTEFKTLQTSLKEAETKSQQALLEARNHQSRADKFQGALKAHNLDPETKPQSPKDSDAAFDLLKQEFMADGMKPEVAEGYAKIFAKAMPTISNTISRSMATTLAPFVGVIGDMKAEKLLNDAYNNDPDGIFQIPEVQKGVTATIKYLASTGQTIDDDTITSIRNMEYGKHVLANPDARRPVANVIATRLAGRGGGHHVQLPRDAKTGAPQAANEDTARAAEATLSRMLKGMKTK